jgi:Flp pilus assembly protein CpaB
MNKLHTRPLLVDNLVILKVSEEIAESEVKEAAPGWEAAALALERWRAARLKRAQAELMLWLADRQWEKEERVEKSLFEQSSVSSPSSKGTNAE